MDDGIGAARVAETPAYSVDILLEGFPGKTLGRGSLGWSTAALLRGGGRVVLVDAGSFGAREALRSELRKHGLRTGDVTDVLLTHAHYDHMVNWVLFPEARVVIGAQELAWAARTPPGSVVPEFYVERLLRRPRVATVGEGDEALPGIRCYHCPGHTPGHMVFVARADDHDVILTGDAAKNRAELLSRRATMSYDPELTTAAIDRIWQLWRARPGSVVVPGHDLPLVVDGDGCRHEGARRTSGIAAWFGEHLSEETVFRLTEGRCGTGVPSAGGTGQEVHEIESA